MTFKHKLSVRLALMRDPRPARPAFSGFTLIEMLLVIVVFGIVVMFTAPNIDLQKFAVDAAMQSVGTTLLAAQRLAVTRQHNMIVACDVTAEALRILDDTNNNGVADPGEHFRTIPLAEHIVFGLGGAPQFGSWAGPISYTKKFGTLPAVTFHRDGSASEAGAIYLTTARAAAAGGHAGDTRMIESDRATARISWFRASPPIWQRGF